MEIKSIQTQIAFGSLNVNYIPCGKVVWLKTKNGEIRQARLEKVVWIGGCKVDCEWKVAGLPNTFHGSWFEIELGSFYSSEHEAQHGRADRSNLALTHSFNIHHELMRRYGNIGMDCYEKEGTWYDFFTLHAYKLNNDGTIEKDYSTPFCVESDKDGVKMYIPSVDNGKRFLTRADALAAYKPVKSITFDD